jgi:NNP family nitrate/nitrite transporter-like MFS transporter
MLAIAYGTVALLLAGVALLPPAPVAVAAFALALAVLGAGNGAVFQLVPLRFARDLGVVTGLVGAAGGLGGFALPSLLGLLRDATGTYATGLFAMAGVCLWGMSLMLAIRTTWRLTWGAEVRVA